MTEDTLPRGQKKSLFLFPVRLLSSKIFLLWLIAGWAVYYVMGAIWMKESFANFAEGLKTSWLIRGPFVLFLIGGYLNLIRAFRERLKRGKGSTFIWAVLPLGAMVFLTGLLIGIWTRQEDWIVAGEGHVVKPSWSTEALRVTKIDSGLEDRILDMDSDTDGGLFRYEPKVTVADQSAKTYTIGAFPATRIGDSYYHILKFGLAPGVNLSSAGQIREEGYMALRLLMPGSNDYFEIPPYPYRFVVSLEPSKIYQKGRLKVSEVNLKNPRFHVKVFRREQVIAEGNSDEAIEFEGFSLRLLDPVIWVQLDVVKDFGYRVILTGTFLLVLGVPLSVLRFFVLWRVSKDSSM